MADVFISYARGDEGAAERIEHALRAHGYAVWRDDQLAAHQSYADEIEGRLRTAKAVLVLWSAEAGRSQWVRAEADFARKAGTLAQASLDGAALPLPFDQVQCADLSAWRGDANSRGWKAVLAGLAALCGGAMAAAVPVRPKAAAPSPAKPAIAVLPFDNMSADPEQEYFSDGITEDIITDLGKVSALSVTARNTVSQFKGKAVDVPAVARQLSVGFVLEGSVRKAGGRVRITAQLIDGTSGDHVWAERYDRDLTDIFALQDEISQAIVAALRLKLLPEERRAITHRDTTNVEAFNLYLMARQRYVTRNMTGGRDAHDVIRLCRGAVDLDPGYARAWALMATAQRMNSYSGDGADGGLEAAERALALDDTLPEAHAARGAVLMTAGDHAGAWAEFETAMRLDPDCYEANHEAARLSYRQQRYRESAAYYETCARVMDDDFSSVSLLMTCYQVLGEPERARDAARRTLAVTEKLVQQDPTHGSAISMMVGALAHLGEPERAKAWAQRALVVDPENLNMRYNLACALIVDLGDLEGGLDLLGPALEGFARERLAHARTDPDLDSVRDHPRFFAMMAKAEARVAED